MGKAVESSRFPEKATEVAARTRRPNNVLMVGGWGLWVVEALTSTPEANVEPWSAAVQAKGMRWREQGLILLPMIQHAPKPSLHFTPGSTSIPGEKDRRELERETWVK